MDKIKTEEDFKKKIEDFLDSIPEDIIKEYAIDNFDLKEDSNIADFDDDDLADELEDRDYDFSEHIDLEASIEYIERNGYTVIENSELDEGLDIIDGNRLEEIKSIFINGSFAEREDLYHMIINRI